MSIEQKVTEMRRDLLERLENARGMFDLLREKELAAAIPALSRDAELHRMLSRRVAFGQQSSVVYNNLPRHLTKTNELA